VYQVGGYLGYIGRAGQRRRKAALDPQLFQVTAERIEAEILGQASVVDEENPWLRLRLGFEKLVDFCAAADVHRIIFVEAPQVIGPEAWRQVELRYAYGILKKTLPVLINGGFSNHIRSTSSRGPCSHC
jgi:hypothetical protein